MTAKIYHSHFLFRLSLLGGLVSVGIAFLTALVLAAAPARAAQPLQGGATCFATLNDGAYVYSGTTAQAVRDAVGAATDGGLIKFAGYCPGALAQDGTTQTVLITKSLSLVGGYTVTDWAQYNPVANPTTLDAQGGGRVINTSAAASVTLQGFTVTNGYVSANGGGIFAGGALTLTDMVVHSNTITSPGFPSGGGVYVMGVALVTNTTIRDNTAQNGQGGGAAFNNTASVTNTSFINNHADNIGGGAWFRDTASVTNTLFINNHAYSGGGAQLGGFLGISYVTGTTFFSNVASSYGGGAVFGLAHVTNSQFISNTVNRSNTRGISAGGGGAHFGLAAEVMDSTFISNTLNSVGGWGVFGGGAYFNASARVTDSTFSDNVVSGDSSVRGGGAYFQDVTSVMRSTFSGNTVSGTWDISGGGAGFQGAASVTASLFSSNIISGNVIVVGSGAVFNQRANVTRTAFLNNTAHGGISASEGGGSYFNRLTSVTDAIFSGNSATTGGGAYFWDSAAVTNTTFTNNTALNNGGGVYFNNAAFSQLVNVLLARNWAGGQGAAVYVGTANALRFIHSTIVSPTTPTGALQAVYVQTGTVYLTNTLIASHTVGLSVAGGTVREWHGLYAGVTTPYTGSVSVTGSLTGSAAFVNPALDDYHLLTTSAALNAGTLPNPSVTFDIDGHTRPQGAGYDIGYDEYWLLFWQYLPFVSK